MTRFQGRSAEKAFSKLCSDMGITCNDSHEDDHGWDHIVEFPQRPQLDVSADMLRPMPPVFVQTKSHSARGLKITMKLSNAVKLARSPSPAFVVLRNSVGPNCNSQEGWYAVHFWDALIGRALKRAREASRDGISEDNFHKHSFTFTMTSVDAHTDDTLLPWIASTVKSVGRDYADAKKTLHPSPEIIGNIKIGPLVSLGELVDHQLGLSENIPFSSITLNLRRFGIDIPLPLPMPKGELVWSKATMHAYPADQCDIRISGPDGSVIEVLADVIAPAIPNLPEDQQKLRIRAPFFDIIWPLTGPSSFTASFNTETKQAPAELEKLTRFFSWSNKGPIDVRATVRDDPLFYGTVSLDQEDSDFFEVLTEQIRTLSKLSSHLKTKIPQISITDFLEAEDAFNLHLFVQSTNLEFKWEHDKNQQYSQVEEFIAMGVASVGDWVFAAIQRYAVIEQQVDNNKVVMELGTPFLLQSYAFHTNDTNTIEHLKADFQRYVKRKGVLGIFNILPELGKSDDFESA